MCALAQTQHTDEPCFRRERQTEREFTKQEASLERASEQGFELRGGEDRRGSKNGGRRTRERRETCGFLARGSLVWTRATVIASVARLAAPPSSGAVQCYNVTCPVCSKRARAHASRFGISPWMFRWRVMTWVSLCTRASCCCCPRAGATVRTSVCSTLRLGVISSTRSIILARYPLLLFAYGPRERERGEFIRKRCDCTCVSVRCALVQA